MQLCGEISSIAVIVPDRIFVNLRQSIADQCDQGILSERRETLLPASPKAMGGLLAKSSGARPR